MTPAAREAVARVWLAQLRRAHPDVVWRLIGEDERLERHLSAATRKRRERHFASPGDVDARSDIDVPAS